jgi:hypothetical protein
MRAETPKDIALHLYLAVAFEEASDDDNPMLIGAALGNIVSQIIALLISEMA